MGIVNPNFWGHPLFLRRDKQFQTRDIGQTDGNQKSSVDMFTAIDSRWVLIVVEEIVERTSGGILSSERHLEVFGMSS
jgi:hypothetical protein